MNPLDDFLMTKHGAPMMPSPSMGSVFGKAMLTGGAGALMTAGVAAAGIAASKIYDAATKVRDFRSMMSSPFNTDLHEHYTSRPRDFNAAYSSLRSVNPDFSKDPMIAGTYMRRMMTYDPASAGGTLVESLSHRDRGPSPMMEALTSGGREGMKAGLTRGLAEHRENELHPIQQGEKGQEEIRRHILQQAGQRRGNT